MSVECDFWFQAKGNPMFAQDASYLASLQTAGKNTAGPKRCLSLQLFGVLSTTERGQLYTFTFVSRTRSLAAGTHLVTAGWQDCEWLHLQKKVVNDRTYLDNHVFSSPSPFPPFFSPSLLSPCPVFIISGSEKQRTGKFLRRNKPTSAYYSPGSRLP